MLYNCYISLYMLYNCYISLYMLYNCYKCYITIICPSLISILDDIENDKGLIVILEDALSKQQDIPFMVIENEGSTERINGIYYYVLYLYDYFINGQKALVTLIGIQVFFDILVPDRETPDKCKEKVSKILSSIMKSFKIEHIKAFPIYEFI